MHDQAQALLATERYYADNAESYAARVIGLDLSALWDKFASLLWPGAKILDLGCGSGRDLKALAARGLKPVGMDYSAALAELARTESGRPVLVADFRSYDFGEAQLDGIWAVASLLHVPQEEITSTIDRLHKALRAPGILLTSMQAGCGQQVLADGRFLQLYAAAEWEHLLQRSGFQTRPGSVTTQGETSSQSKVTWFVTIGVKRGNPRSPADGVRQ
jgi:SAM-dependent methyltransferase